MENNMEISFSAATHIGAACTVNNDRIFANGRYIYQSPADFAQISLDVSDGKCFFALSECMEDEESGISLTNDLKKFHQKAAASTKDIHIKLDDLVQCVEQSSNLLHSISLGENYFKDRKPSFAGILIDEGNIAAVNLGNCRIYKLEGETFKLLVNDYKKAERLLKMGIISNEQAEMLSGQQKASLEEGISTVKKSDINPLRAGVVYLICSRGLTDAVSEDAIYEIISSGGKPDEIAGKLVEAAFNNESENNITAIIIKVESAGEQQDELPVSRVNQYRPARSVPSSLPPRNARVVAGRHKQSPDFGRIASLVILFILVAAVVYGGFKFWMMLTGREAQGTTAQQETTLSADDTALDESSTADAAGTAEGAGTPDENGTTSGSAIETGDAGSNGNDSDAGSGNGSGTGSGKSGDSQVKAEGTTYIVKSGDMLMNIAKKFYGDENKYKLIMDANGLTNPDKITEGQKLIIPPVK
ncbi:MAG TPA: LysM peptidoglycan-binding domain-containing protein [Clostridia bacterium]|nr:LysM peptidoglycan-binding domain-containing protein [Clostridia bacterium]